MDDSKRLTSVDDYIAQFPSNIQERLQTIRKLIIDEAPEAKETMSWRMPTYVYFGNLVHFAAHKNHLGFYPGAEGIATFQADIAKYQWSKGAVQFPYNQPLPLDLIQQIVRFRLKQNKEAAEQKKNKQKERR